jgi:phosphopentomutase
MSRAMILVLDSVGCGGAADAARYGDEGSDTLGHIAQACAEGRGDRAGLRAGPLTLPNLDALGLWLACTASTGRLPAGFARPPRPRALAGYGIEVSQGKDTPSGHWEINGAPVDFAWGYFPDTQPSFPPALTQALIAQGGLPGVLGDKHASGTAILDELGEAHMRSGKPIVYTSVDSVMQIAAHEETFGLERLYELCRLARRLCDPLNIGRVIARPFVGARAGEFRRTPRRKDFAIPPPDGGLLQRASEAGRAVVAIGKIGDIFAHRFTGEEIKGASNDAHFDIALASLAKLPDGGLAFVNLVDFDTEYGHRRDVAGYAACLEAFDRRLPELLRALQPGDLLVITADHGNDPTWPGTDHTREHVPILAYRPGLPGGGLGGRATFADIGASVAAHLGLPATARGTSFL